MSEEYKSNSHRSKEQEPAPQKKTEKVVSGDVQRKKKSGFSKAMSTFLPGEVSSVKDYILFDAVIPSVRKVILDIVYNGLSILLGENPGKEKGSSAGARVSYRKYYDDRDDRPNYSRPRAIAQYSYDDITFDNRGDAEAVLDRMDELLDRFDVVSVADLFDMAGLSCNYTDNKYGWTDLKDARVERLRDGRYYINLPRATTL